MNILLASYLVFCSQLAFQPAGNDLAWLDMPTNTVQERTAREAARKNWAKKKRTLDAMSKSTVRKQRMTNARNYQIQQQRQWQQWQQCQQQYRYRNLSYGNNYGPRYRYINVPTPTGTVRYLVPY